MIGDVANECTLLMRALIVATALGVFVSALCAIIPVAPITIEITGTSESPKYTIAEKQMGFEELLPFLKTQYANFGTFRSCDIWISDSVPMSSVIKVHRAFKESGPEGKIGIYLIFREPGIVQPALHRITITPFPEPPEIPPMEVPPMVTPPSVLSLPTK